MISINKKKNPFTQPIGRSRNVVGLDVEAGSIAATEVAVNGSVSVSRFGVAPLAAGAVRDGEVHDPALLSDSIKELFASQKFPKDVRVGIANQRVAVRTIRLMPGAWITATPITSTSTPVPAPLISTSRNRSGGKASITSTLRISTGSMRERLNPAISPTDIPIR